MKKRSWSLFTKKEIFPFSKTGTTCTPQTRNGEPTPPRRDDQEELDLD